MASNDASRREAFLSADKPLSNPDEDVLGYKDFARNLADAICQMIPTDGLVMSIYGAWGSGKSTVLKFVEHYLREKPEEEQPIIIYFNPWWFSGREDLTRNFFSQLQVVLGDKLEGVGKELKEKIGKFAKLVSKVPTTFIPLPGTLVESSKEVATLIGGMLTPSDVDIAKLKEEIEATLRKQPKRILIVIDDIDRLTSEEIRELFRFIKAVADFPKVTYLLAFDKEVVVKALKESQNVPGEAYLEKIVQVPFELPLPNKLALRRLLSERIEQILRNLPSELIEDTFLGRKGYLVDLENFIRTPRDIMRFTNSLNALYPSVKDEVHAADFVAIEAIRAFCPTLYDAIRRNPAIFTGRQMSQSDIDFFDHLLESVPTQIRTPVEKLLKGMFPTLNNRGVFSTSGPGFESIWRRQLRICSPEIFETYFRWAIPETGISDAEMKRILDLTENSAKFGSEVIALSEQRNFGGINKVSVFLDRLSTDTENLISSERTSFVVQALLEVGDKLRGLDDASHPRPYDENTSRIISIIGRLLYQLNEASRFEILRMSMEVGQARLTILTMMATLWHQYGRFGYPQSEPEDRRLIAQSHLQSLETICLEKVRFLANDSAFHESHELLFVLSVWGELNTEEMRNWVRKDIQDDEHLIKFIAKFPKLASYPPGEYKIELNELSLYLDPDEIIDRVREILQKNSLSEEARIIATAFVSSYDTRDR